MSDHSCPVVRVSKRPHPNADSLSLVDVLGFTVAVRTADWRDGDLGAYIPPDSVVDSSRPEFAFLAGHERIKVKKLRGVYSQGLLIPAPEGLGVGADAADALGVIHYEPKVGGGQTTGGEAKPAPPGAGPTYDVENYRRNKNILVWSERVVITEKIHGANARYLFVDGEVQIGSKGEWKKGDDNLWARALKNTPGIAAWCEAHPGRTLYGEIYGPVQDLKYGKKDVAFAAFDAFESGIWMSWPGLVASCAAYGVPMVPLLFEGPLEDGVESYAEGRSTIPGADHVREGCVVRPYRDRFTYRGERVHLKIVGNGYMEKA